MRDPFSLRSRRAKTLAATMLLFAVVQHPFDARSQETGGQLSLESLNTALQGAATPEDEEVSGSQDAPPLTAALQVETEAAVPGTDDASEVPSLPLDLSALENALTAGQNAQSDDETSARSPQKTLVPASQRLKPDVLNALKKALAARAATTSQTAAGKTTLSKTSKPATQPKSAAVSEVSPVKASAGADASLAAAQPKPLTLASNASSSCAFEPNFDNRTTSLKAGVAKSDIVSIYFPQKSHKLDIQSMAKLHRHATSLRDKTIEGAKIVLVSHSVQTIDDDALAGRRAQNIASCLGTLFGINQKAIIAFEQKTTPSLGSLVQKSDASKRRVDLMTMADYERQRRALTQSAQR